MKKKYLMAMVLALLCFNVNAQPTYGFEDCLTDGIPPPPNPWWNPWGCQGPCDFYCSSDNPHSGEWCGLMPNDETTDAILDLGNRIFGEWGLEFWMFIPSDREGYFNLQGTVPIGSGEWIVGNIFFNQDLLNPGVGLIDDTALGEVYFDFPHDEWFRILMNVDISGGIGVATWEFNVDYTEVIPAGTPFTDGAGTYPTSLGGIDFFSLSADTEYYIDDIYYTDYFIDPFGLTTDDMEDYVHAQPIFENWWTTWGCGSGPNCALLGSSVQARSGIISGLVPSDGTQLPVLDLGNQTSGERSLEFYLYIPGGTEATFNLQGEIPITTGEWIVGDFYFNRDINNPGEGHITDTALGLVYFDFPHDEWFRVVMNYDLSNGMNNATWGCWMDDTLVIPEGTAFTNLDGQYPTSLGGVGFISLEYSEMYIDDINFKHGFTLMTTENKYFEFSVYPNPTTEHLNIASEVAIDRIAIYSLDGSIVLTTGQTESVDVSVLSSGIYFVEVYTSEGKSVQKFIKQ